MNRFLIRITKGLLYTFYPEIDYTEMHFKTSQINPSQEVADFMYKKLIYDEKGDGALRFWHLLVTNDPNCHGV